MTGLPSHSGLGAEEPVSSTPEDPGSPLSTGYNTRSGSEEMVTEPRASLHGSRELPASARTRMRTASELLLDRCARGAAGGAGGGWASAWGQNLPERGPCRCLRIPELEEAEQFEARQGRALRLLQAVYQCVAAHSELLCYFIIVLNHMVTASATSLVLPVLVFLWAMLSIPRPSKRFWMTAIVFTEVGSSLGGGGDLAPPAVLSPAAPQVMVVTKYLFQFGFFPWNSHTVLRRYENKPYFPPRILGLEKKDSYIKYDLVQLLALFFHRSQLLVSARRQGGWAAGRHLWPSCSRRRSWTSWGPGWAWPCLPPQGPSSFLPSFHSAMASGTTMRTRSPRSLMGAMGRRSRRRSQACWDSRLRRAWGPGRSWGWPGSPPRMTSK